MGLTSSRPPTYVYSTPSNTTSGDVALLLIDPQNDFHPGGSLAVPTADEDTSRLVELIRGSGKTGIDAIFVTLDTHQTYHIAHQVFWEDEKGEHPEPFTTISVEDVETKRWRPVDATLKEHVLHYTRKLREGGEFELLIWPDHCLVGTEGHAVRNNLAKEIKRWARQSKGRAARYVLKGHNALTEHYSAFQAEVPIENDPNTQLNTTLLSDLNRFRRIFVGGQAMSHCVNWSVRHLIDNWDATKLDRIAVLEDCCSPVPGFETKAEDFVAYLKEKGVRVLSAQEAAQEISEASSKPSSSS